VGTLFAAFLGYNPIRTLVGPHVLAHVGPAHAAVLTGKRFFPSLISGPFHHGLVIAFSASALLCAAAGAASWWAGNPVAPEEDVVVGDEGARAGNGTARRAGAAPADRVGATVGAPPGEPGAAITGLTVAEPVSAPVPAGRNGQESP
jgi:hypothetical protein